MKTSSKTKKKDVDKLNTPELKAIQTNDNIQSKN